MQVLFVAGLISLTQLLFFGFCGLGLVRLLLPLRLHAYEVVLAPVFGLAFLAMVGFYGANVGLTMRGLVPLVVVVALGLLVGARVCHGGWRPGVLTMRELVPLAVLMVGTWGLCVLPLWGYGALLPIGHNWDVEFYLPLAAYLKDYSYATLAQAPGNPLRDLVMSERIAARAMGATYAQALVDVVGGWDAWDSWVPMLATLRVLTLAGLYALLREGLGARVGGALVGCGLVMVNGLLLWTTYNSFGMGLGGLALLPAALVCVLVALEGGERGEVLPAVVLLGGISCTYWPMLQPYGAGALGCGLALLWERRRGGWLEVIGRGLGVLVGGGVLGVLAHVRAGAAFLGVFEARSASMGVVDFIAPTVIVGSAPFSHLGPLVTGMGGEVMGWGGFVLAMVVAVYGLWFGGRRRAVTLGFGVCCLAYVLGLRFVVGFPYGYLRGSSYINSLLLGVMGMGVVPYGRLGRGEGAVSEAVSVAQRVFAGFRGGGWQLCAGMVVMGCCAVASYQTYAVYAVHPAVFDQETVAMRAAVAQLGRSGAVSVSAAPELRGPYLGAWAYTLRDRALLGSFRTGFGAFDAVHLGVTPVYGVVRRGEDPDAYGLDRAAQVWQGERSALYAAPVNQVAWLNGRLGVVAEGQLLSENTNMSRAQIGGGSYLAASPGVPLVLYSDGVTIGQGVLSGKGAIQAGFRLALASFVAQTVEVRLGDDVRRLAIPAGLSVYRTGQVTMPVRVEVRVEVAPLVLRWAALDRVVGMREVSALTPMRDTVVLGVTSTLSARSVSTHLRFHNDSGEQFRVGVEVYEVVPGYEVAPVHYAWASFPGPGEGAHTLDLDLGVPSMMLDGVTVPSKVGAVRDGSYFAALWVYRGERVQQVIPFLRFERRAGVVGGVLPLDVNAAFVYFAPAAQALGAHFGDGFGLRGFEVGTTVVHAGGHVRVSLVWGVERPPTTMYLVFVQVLDDANRKVAQWDGAVGGDWWPTTVWRQGQGVWQDVPLEVAVDAPPGRYRVLVGVYDPVSGERLRLSGGDDALVLGMVDVQP